MDVFQYVGSIGGIGGVLALLLWLMVKYLIAQMREDRKFMEDRLTDIINNYNKTISDSTRATTELITWLKTKNGSKL